MGVKMNYEAQINSKAMYIVSIKILEKLKSVARSKTIMILPGDALGGAIKEDLISRTPLSKLERIVICPYCYSIYSFDKLRLWYESDPEGFKEQKCISCNRIKLYDMYKIALELMENE